MIISRTPFRISFFGGGTDYPVWYENNGGAVLSTSIDKYTYLAVRSYPPFFPVKHRIVWSKIESVNSHDEIEHPAVREILKYLGVEDGVEMHAIADLPARSGLGSSSAFVVGLLHAMHRFMGHEVTKSKLALEAIHVEQNLIQENVGSQDQVATAYGGFNKITFSPGNKIHVEPVAVSGSRLGALNDHLMLFFTGFSRTASEVAAEWIKSAPKKEKELHEMHRMVDRAIGILKDEQVPLEEFGKLLHETWQLKRGLNSAVTTSHIDEVYDRARKAGAIGGKLLGAGQGGFMLIYAAPEIQPKVKLALKDLLYVPFRFEELGSHTIQNGNAPELIAY